MSQLHVRVVTPLGVYKEFDTPIINIQTEDGNQGVLAKHMQYLEDYFTSEKILQKF